MPRAFNRHARALLGVLALTLLLGAAAQAQRAKGNGAQLRPIREPLLVVTHPTTIYDPDSLSRRGLTRLIRRFRDSQLPFIYLMGAEDDPKTYFVIDRHPFAALASISGEHEIPLAVNRVTTAGGYLHRCHAQTIEDLVANYLGDDWDRRVLTLDYVTDAIYVDEEDLADELREKRNRPEGHVDLLSDIVQDLDTDAALIEFFRHYLAAAALAELEKHDGVTYVLARSGHVVGTLHEGAAGAPTVTINLLTSRSPELPALQAPRNIARRPSNRQRPSRNNVGRQRGGLPALQPAV